MAIASSTCLRPIAPGFKPGHRERARDSSRSYYDEVIAVIRDAQAILILGPGEAKGELKKRLERDKLGGRILAPGPYKTPHIHRLQ